MGDASLLAAPHRRWNPLIGEWLLVSPQRTARPWQGQVETASVEERSAYDPTCYLCPGNSRAGGVRNPNYAETFVFENDFAALRPDAVSVSPRATISRYPASSCPHFGTSWIPGPTNMTRWAPSPGCAMSRFLRTVVP